MLLLLIFIVFVTLDFCLICILYDSQYTLNNTYTETERERERERLLLCLCIIIIKIYHVLIGSACHLKIQGNYSDVYWSVVCLNFVVCLISCQSCFNSLPLLCPTSPFKIAFSTKNGQMGWKKKSRSSWNRRVRTAHLHIYFLVYAVHKGWFSEFDWQGKIMKTSCHSFCE